jgi:hypothetical protein
MPNRIEIPDRFGPGRSRQQRTEPEDAPTANAKPDDRNTAPVAQDKSGATNAQVYGLLLVSLGAILLIVLGLSFQRSSLVAMADFKQVFYGARCLLTGCDLYSEQQVQRIYFAEGDEPQAQKLKLANNIIWSPYPPATYMLVTPFAALSWRCGRS